MNYVCPNCGGLWPRLYQASDDLRCRMCYRQPDERKTEFALARVIGE